MQPACVQVAESATAALSDVRTTTIGNCPSMSTTTLPPVAASAPKRA